MKIDNDAFKLPLEPLYSQRNIPLDTDIEYLVNAYKHTEKLWWDNFLSMEKVKYVLVAEAPRYGEEKSYIYNPKISGTSFLGVCTVNKISENLGIRSRLAGKPDMLKRMRELGLLVVDLFPYAFNPQTQLEYEGIGCLYRKTLCKASSNWHLKPKFLEIEKKSNRTILCGVRYSRLFPFASDTIKHSYPNETEIIVEKAYKVKIANAPLDIEKISNSLKLYY